MNWNEFKKLSLQDKRIEFEKMTEKEKIKIRKQKRNSDANKIKKEILNNMGLTKVKGAITGHIYYE